MDAQGIVDYAVKHTGLTISVTDALTYVNKRRNQVADTIKEKINQGYFWEEFTTDIIAGQREYPLPVADYDKEGISAIDRVEVKQKSTDVYRTLQRNSTVPSSYDEMAGGATYFYIVKDSSIILFPTPTESIVGGLVLYANTTLKDVEESTVESEIF